MIYAWFLAPKMKYCLVIDIFGVIAAKRVFKGNNEEHRVIRPNEFIWLSEGKTLSGRFSIDWSETFEGIEIPYRKQGFLDCDNGRICSDCEIKPNKNCFNCKLERVCETYLDQITC